MLRKEVTTRTFQSNGNDYHDSQTVEPLVRQEVINA